MRTWAFGMAALMAASLLAGGTARAASINACAKLSNGKLRKLTVDTAPPPSCNVNTEAPVSVGADTSPVVAFARVDLASNAATSFGGNGTSNVNVQDGGVGLAQVTFTGTYAATLDASKLTVLTTAQSNNYDVTNAVVALADSTQIIVLVYDWYSNVGAGGEDDNTVFVALLAAP
jgi:hypothetical protein